MRKLCITLLLLFSLPSFSQDIGFLVYYTKGGVTNAKRAALKKGDKLYSADRITVPQGAQVVLLCKNYNTLKLATKGSFAVKELMQTCTKTKPSFSSSYFQYVWDELTHPHGSPEKDPSQYMRNSGAVSRGCPVLELQLPIDTLVYASGSLPIYYKTSLQSPVFSVYAEADGGDALYSFPLENKPVQIEQVKRQLQKPGLYYWQITSSDGEGCERSVLEVLSKTEMAAKTKKLLKDVLLTTPAETAFAKGFVLEENHFFAEAFTYYKLAYQLNPKNEIYKTSYARYHE